MLAGTLLLLVPQGLASLADTFTAYLRGWVRPSGEMVLRMLAALVFYQPLALFFGIAGSIRGWIEHEPLSQRFSLWALIALALALIYPARQAMDLVWTLIPLWFLAAWELPHHLPVEAKVAAYRWPSLVFASGVVVLLGVAWMGLTAERVLLVLLALAMLLAVMVIDRKSVV